MSEYLRENILMSARVAWHELLTHENDFVIKKVEPRDTFEQLLYKMKKIFSDERAPGNTLKIVHTTDNTRPWYQSKQRHKNVYVRIEAFVCPLQGNERLDGPHIYARFEEKPVPLALLSVYIQAKHFYDDSAPRECAKFTEQVHEKFGPLNVHISGLRPTLALDKGALLRYYKKVHKIGKWDEILEDFIDLDDDSAQEWSKKHWNTSPNDAAGA
jgi:hypothetical protein